MFSKAIREGWNVGRGRKFKTSGKYAFFILLTIVKHGSNWDFLGVLFDLKGPTFERIIFYVLDVLSDFSYDVFVERLAKTWTMARPVERNQTLKTFIYARYAADVTFQQCNRPGRNMAEGKPYYSAKHKLYGYKVE